MINFIAGILFIYVCIPILESLTETIQMLFEQCKAKSSVKIAKYNAQINEINKGKNKQPIGFIKNLDEEDG